MNFIKKPFKILLLVFLSLVILSGCSDSKEQQQVNLLAQENNFLYTNNKELYQDLISNINHDKHGLYQSTLKAALINVKKEMPDNKEIDQLEKQFTLDMTTKGTVFKSIEKKYTSVMNNPHIKFFEKISDTKNFNIKDINKFISNRNELMALNQILSYSSFDNNFIDYINTLAAISTSVKPVVVKNVEKDSPIGSAFVGNPNYGNWVTDKNGDTHWSFLETYMYMSVLNNMLSNHNSFSFDRNHDKYTPNYSSYKYDNWRNKRGYSYYNDTYVKRYASTKEKNTYAKYQSNLSKKYSNSIDHRKKAIDVKSPSKYNTFQSNISQSQKTRNIRSGKEAAKYKSFQSNIGKAKKSNNSSFFSKNRSFRSRSSNPSRSFGK